MDLLGCLDSWNKIHGLIGCLDSWNKIHGSYRLSRLVGIRYMYLQVVYIVGIRYMDLQVVQTSWNKIHGPIGCLDSWNKIHVLPQVIQTTWNKIHVSYRLSRLVQTTYKSCDFMYLIPHTFLYIPGLMSQASGIFRVSRQLIKILEKMRLK